MAYRRAIEVHQQLASSNPKVVIYQTGIASAYNNIGTIYSSTSWLHEARIAFEQALRIRNKVLVTDPDSLKNSDRIGHLHNHIGKLCSQAGEMPEALEEYREGLKTRVQLVKKSPENAMYRNNLAQSQQHCRTLLQVGKAKSIIGRVSAVSRDLGAIGRRTSDSLEVSWVSGRHVSERWNVLHGSQRFQECVWRMGEGVCSASAVGESVPKRTLKSENTSDEALRVCEPL